MNTCRRPPRLDPALSWARRMRFSTHGQLRHESVAQLPFKAEIETGPLGRQARMHSSVFLKLTSPNLLGWLHSYLHARVEPRFTLVPKHGNASGAHSLKWVQPPKSVLLIKKPKDQSTSNGARQVIQRLRSNYNDISIVVEPSVSKELSSEFPFLIAFSDADRFKLSSSIDLVIALGGDGTVLHTSSLFDNGPVPPVIGLTMGTLDLNEFDQLFDEVLESKSEIMLRMRLDCSVRCSKGTIVQRPKPVGCHVMNEVSLHRGSSPHMTAIEAFVDSQLLTCAVADGLVIATPTGSTAYSLSAGGPIVHPAVQTILLTPICPRSLSFRSVLLPSEVCIQLKVDKGSRSPAELSLDGREIQLLYPGEHLNVSMSPYPVPCITRHRPITQIPLRPFASTTSMEQHVTTSTTRGDSWVQDINEMLSFNTTFKAKGVSHLALAEEGDQL